MPPLWTLADSEAWTWSSCDLLHTVGTQAVPTAEALRVAHRHHKTGHSAKARVVIACDCLMDLVKELFSSLLFSPLAGLNIREAGVGWGAAM